MKSTKLKTITEVDSLNELNSDVIVQFLDGTEISIPDVRTINELRVKVATAAQRSAEIRQKQGQGEERRKRISFLCVSSGSEGDEKKHVHPALLGARSRTNRRRQIRMYAEKEKKTYHKTYHYPTIDERECPTPSRFSSTSETSQRSSVSSSSKTRCSVLYAKRNSAPATRWPPPRLPSATGTVGGGTPAHSSVPLTRADYAKLSGADGARREITVRAKPPVLLTESYLCLPRYEGSVLGALKSVMRSGGSTGARREEGGKKVIASDVILLDTHFSPLCTEQDDDDVLEQRIPERVNVILRPADVVAKEWGKKKCILGALMAHAVVDDRRGLHHVVSRMKQEGVNTSHMLALCALRCIAMEGEGDEGMMGANYAELRRLLDGSRIELFRIVHLLMEAAGSAAVDLTDLMGQSALMLATVRNQELVVRVLLQLKASVDLPDYYLRTPLLEACRAGNGHIASVLLRSNADLGHRDDLGRTPLMEAVSNGHALMASALVKYSEKHHVDFGLSETENAELAESILEVSNLKRVRLVEVK